jgi:hypothetical protein
MVSAAAAAAPAAASGLFKQSLHLQDTVLATIMLSQLCFQQLTPKLANKKQAGSAMLADKRQENAFLTLNSAVQTSAMQQCAAVQVMS